MPLQLHPSYRNAASFTEMPRFAFTTPERDLTPEHLWNEAYVKGPIFQADYDYLRSQQQEIDERLWKQHAVYKANIHPLIEEAIRYPDASERCTLLRLWLENREHMTKLETLASRTNPPVKLEKYAQKDNPMN
ncbi:hypothetical protein NMY22_g12618 [Coprinellus aureogranulatus]|nr:hypothetical protein NMY22_g12618 [Coprinellus aureogranulatus]